MKAVLISVAFTAVIAVVVVRLNNGATADSTLGKIFGKKA